MINSMKKYRSSDKFKEWQKAYRKRRLEEPEYHERLKHLKRENGKKNIITRILKAASVRAIKNNLEFDITREDIIIPEICPLLSIPISPGCKGDYTSSPSLDRVDNSKGYVKSNIRIISSLANTMKNCASKEQLLEFCKNIPKYLDNDIV